MNFSISSLLVASFFVSVSATGCAPDSSAVENNARASQSDEIASSSDALRIYVSGDAYVSNCNGGTSCCFGGPGGSIIVGEPTFISTGSAINEATGLSGWHCVSGNSVGPAVPPPAIQQGGKTADLRGGTDTLDAANSEPIGI